MYITRALEPVVRRYSGHFKVIVVTGPRQVGKTTMLRHLMEEDAANGAGRSYVSLDNTAILQTAKDDPALFLQRYSPPVLIDEIQKAPELLPYIKEVVDASDQNGTVWLTGSQPFHLMKEVSESLAGRVGVIEMLGLSGAEIAGTASEPFSPGPDYFVRRVAASASYDVAEAYERICAGSLPGIRALPDDLRPGGYESYLDTYIMRDIRDLSQIGDELKFRRFMTACAALTSKPVVYAELARIADIDEKTAKTWLSLLVSSYIVKVVEPYANNLLKRLSKQPIMHFLDTGLAAYLTGWTSPRALEAGAMSGQMFETYAFGEIYKSFLNAGRRAPLCFFRNNDKKEIDLLMESDGTLYPIEVKKTASPSKKDARNLGVLDPVAADDVPAELAALRREIGTGAIVCMTRDTFPVSERAWAFPVWAV
ncbi:ATP-binding protein [Olsenella profusa]|uniref:ATP-binding protein n=1 Tax=Olsenella profusa TaxID=138595 RepID=A0ABS2F293_9ACTN|nr:ATP-binding protein [Olsenella profusa]MBM6775109.1 ATP-binding protein [Olsenella profusa]